MTTLTAKVLFSGEASGPVLCLDAPLSFWGGFDPATGDILDKNHPQQGRCIAGKVLVLPATRGSGGTPGGIAEAIRKGTAPAAIIMREADTNVMIGAAVAHKLYGLRCPVLEICGRDYETVANATSAVLTETGQVTVKD